MMNDDDDDDDADDDDDDYHEHDHIHIKTQQISGAWLNPLLLAWRLPDAALAALLPRSGQR